MSRNFRLWQNGQVISLLKPAADAAGRTSGFFSLMNAHKAYVVCQVNQGNAATVSLTVTQAQDILGTNAKALTAVAPIAVNLDTDTIPSDVLSIATSALNYTTDAGVKNKLVIFEIDPIESMDLNSNTLNASGVPQPFNHIAITTGASNAANITAATLILMPLRYQQSVPPSAAV